MKSDRRDVVITGLGPVSSVGVGVDAVWEALKGGQANVTSKELQVDAGVTESLPIAAMPPIESVPGLDRSFQFLSDQECAAHRDLAYAMLASELAIADAGLTLDPASNNVGAIQAFEAPGVEQTVLQLFGMLSAPPPMDGPPPTYNMLAPHFYNMQAFVYVHLLAKFLGLHGFSTSVHNACSSGAIAIETAASHIRSGQADVMLVVAGEAFETAVRLEWFRRLELYARKRQMRPFDRDPSGFYVGEGGAALVLESRGHALQRGARIYAGYLGGRFSQQAWKQTVPDVRSARMAQTIRGAIDASKIAAADIDLVVPHGASGRVSDGYEASCLGEALKGSESRAMVTALKPYFGHTLAASALIETIGMLLAARRDFVPATLNTSADRVDLPLPVATQGMERPIRTMLKLATGFTGHDAALLFQSE